MFCTNCGANIPDGSNVCPNCGFVFNNNVPNVNNNEPAAPAPEFNGAPNPDFNAAPNPDMYQSYQSNNENFNGFNGADGNAANDNGPSFGGIALALGITGIAGSFLFGMLFGTIAALLFTIISAGGLVLAINAKKNNAPKAQAALICSIIGLALGLFMMIGCAICGAVSEGYMCYGCIGGSCKAANDVANEWEDIYRALY